MKKYIFRRSTARADNGAYITSVYEIFQETELMYLCNLRANIFLLRSYVVLVHPPKAITRFFEKSIYKAQTANEYYEEIHLF